MRHLRSDYNRIQDPENKIEEDEPVFLLRAQDKLFLSMVMFYSDMQRNIGNKELFKFINEQVPKIREWQTTHKTKNADLSNDSKPGLL